MTVLPLTVISRNIGANASPFDLLVYEGSIADSPRLLPLDKWLRNGQPCNAYKSARKPTYQLTFDWSNEDDEGPVFVINKAMEACFGMRGLQGWELWIKGQQLDLLLKDFREEYVRLQNSSTSMDQMLLLDLWIDTLRAELSRIDSLPVTASNQASLNVQTFSGDRPRRSSRSPSPALFPDEHYDRFLPTKHIGVSAARMNSKKALWKRASNPPIFANDTSEGSPFSRGRQGGRSIPSSTSDLRGKNAEEDDLMEEDDDDAPPDLQDSDYDDSVKVGGEEKEDEGDQLDSDDKGEDEEEDSSSDDSLPGRRTLSETLAKVTGKSKGKVKVVRQGCEADPAQGSASVSSVRTRPSSSTHGRSQAEEREGRSTKKAKKKGKGKAAVKSSESSGKKRKRVVSDDEEDLIELDSEGDVVEDYTTPTTKAKSKPKGHPASTPTTPSSITKEDTLVYKSYRAEVGEDGRTRYWCLLCPKGKSIGRLASTTSNLIKHQGDCKGLAQGVVDNHPGILPRHRREVLKKTVTQSTIEPGTGALHQPFSEMGLKARLFHWVCATSQTFSVVSSPEFKELLQFCERDVSVPCRTTVSNYIKKSYELSKGKVDAAVTEASKHTYIHYAHDTWTDTSMSNCYMGLYASWIDEEFKLQEVLLRFMHLRGRHTGVRIGNAIFSIFSAMGIADRIGPGTGDNAANNKSAARHLAARLEDEETYSINGEHIVGCACHTLNLAAFDFLNNEAKLTSDDYPDDVPASVPNVRVVGISYLRTDGLAVSPGASAEPDLADNATSESDTDSDDQPEETSIVAENGVGVVRPIAGMSMAAAEEKHAADVLAAKRSAAKLARRKAFNASPVGKAHNFAKYVLSSPTRREAFQKIRRNKQPDLKKDLLPKKDVSTRWNSTYEAICRLIDLKETVIAFCNQYADDKCPKLSKDTFRALEAIKPSLEHFDILTKRYSTVHVNIHRVMVDFHLLIQTLKAGHDKAAPDRRPSFKSAMDKMEKYLVKMLGNDWICAATVLDPWMKEKGLHRLLTEYPEFDADERTQEVLDWILARAEAYRIADDLEEDLAPDAVEFVETRVNLLESNPFASLHASHDPTLASGDCLQDGWKEYNAPQPQDRMTLPRQQSAKRELILVYWRRQILTNRRLTPLARVAKDILGIPASSTSIERCFSVSGNTLADKRKSMKPEMVLKQTSQKIWGDQGFSTLKDFESLCA